MGVIQFDVDYPAHIPSRGLSHADFVMFDGRIIPSQTVLSGHHLICNREQSKSSQLRLLYQPHPNGAPVVAHSTSLREGATNYSLEVELARGELSRLRNCHGAWVGAGLRSSERIDGLRREAQRSFFRSATGNGPSSDAIESLLITREAMGELCRLYTAQRLAYRRERGSQFPVSLGCTLRDIPRLPDRFLTAFSATILNTSWAQLEPEDGQYEWDSFDALVNWAAEHRLFIQGGPLLDLVHDSFPEWMKSWQTDHVNLQSFASDFVETVVRRYVGRIRHWEVVCGANCGASSDLTEEQRLNLVVRTVEAARQVDEQIQISLRIVQPWGEYLSQTENLLAPIQFVDTLRRTGVRIAEVNLELRFGQGPWCSQPRDQLAMSQLLDHWSLLQMPLNVIVSLPDFFPEAEQTQSILDQQAQWLRQVMMLLLSKERVAGVYCDGWHSDDETGGLLLADETLHPAWEQVCGIEADCWHRGEREGIAL